jgi:hypothetical protein
VEEGAVTDSVRYEWLCLECGEYIGQAQPVETCPGCKAVLPAEDKRRVILVETKDDCIYYSAVISRLQLP